MNKKIVIGIGGLLLGMAMALHSSQVDFPKLSGPYLGQKPPGKKPEPFAVGIFAPRYTDHHTNIAFSPDGKEAYWNAREIPTSPNDLHIQGIYTSQILSGHWTKPQPAPWGRDNDAPFISPDWKKLFFISDRPLEEGGKSDRETIWSMDRTPDGWSGPRPLPPIINSMKYIHWGISVDRLGNLYFGVIDRPSSGSIRSYDIYCSKYVKGQYHEPGKLPISINGSGRNFSPFISPDGGYIIFSRQREVGGKWTIRLFISNKQKGGAWTTAKEINEVKMEGKDLYYSNPYVSPDGKYLFFLYFGGEVVNNSAIITHYWVDASFIEELRKKELHED